TASVRDDCVRPFDVENGREGGRGQRGEGEQNANEVHIQGRDRGAEVVPGHDPYQLHPRTSLSIGAYKKDSDCNVGVVILDKIVACRTTVKDNKGFE
ncbi:unnamed protein product, partial [Ectocarpus sp. 12 AP-2014]